MSWRRGGYFYTPYINHLNLSDGRVLSIHFTTKERSGRSGDPDDDYSETTYCINGKSVEWSELPAEVTAEVIKELERTAGEDTGFDTGEDDF